MLTGGHYDNNNNLINKKHTNGDSHRPLLSKDGGGGDNIAKVNMTPKVSNAILYKARMAWVIQGGGSKTTVGRQPRGQPL
jgi:hypothetical protein